MVDKPYCYVVRIYRRGYARLEGLVEDARTGNAQAFANVEQLWTLLRRPITRKRRVGGGLHAPHRKGVRREPEGDGGTQ